MKEISRTVTNFRHSIELPPSDQIRLTYTQDDDKSGFSTSDVLHATRSLLEGLVQFEPPFTGIIDQGDIMVASDYSTLSVSYNRTDATTTAVPEGWQMEGWMTIVEMVRENPDLQHFQSAIGAGTELV